MSSPQNGTKTGVQRDAKGRLVKGSGAINPGGRPKQAAHLRARCQSATDELVVDAWEAEVRAQGPDWVKCSELLAAYGYGKPSSSPEDLDAVKGNPLSGLTTQEILDAVRRP